MEIEKSRKVRETGSPKAAAKTDTNVWQDVHAYFRELFTEHKNADEVKFTLEELISDMDARFRGRYNAEMIAKLLSNGFEVSHGHYVFKRDDFFPVLKNRIGEGEGLKVKGERGIEA